MTQEFHTTITTRLGHMRAVSNGNQLIRLDWDQSVFTDPDRPDNVSRETAAQLAAYLAGRLKIFDLPLRAEGKSDAGQAWLAAMARIPYGQIVSYAEFAAAAGMPGAARAAGSACAGNPFPIIYPCHRVVRAGGALGNYGGGSRLDPKHPDNLGRKQALIDLERRYA